MQPNLEVIRTDFFAAHVTLPYCALLRFKNHDSALFSLTVGPHHKPTAIPWTAREGGQLMSRCEVCGWFRAHQRIGYNQEVV